MGYESRLIVVEREDYDNGYVFGDEIMQIDLSKMGYDRVDGRCFTDIFKNEIDFNLYMMRSGYEDSDDPNRERKDAYGAICKWATIDAVIEWLEKADMDYRRAKTCLSVLKALKEHEKDYANICVVHYGYQISERGNNMETLKKIYKLIHNANEEFYGLYEKYPTVKELKDSEEYKMHCVKVKAYEEVFKIVRDDLRELRNMIGEMVDL